MQRLLGGTLSVYDIQGAVRPAIGKASGTAEMMRSRVAENGSS